MPHLLSPFENTRTAAALNETQQMTRRQFDMVVAQVPGMTIAGVRRLQLTLIAVSLLFIAWFGLYSLDEGPPNEPSMLVAFLGMLLIVGCGLVGLALVARLLYDVFGITANSEDLARDLRQRIRNNALDIRTTTGLLQFEHLLRGRQALYEVKVGRCRFPVSQALWEALQAEYRSQVYKAHFLEHPYVLLSVIARDVLDAKAQLPEDEPAVTGRTLARRGDIA